MIEVSIVLVVVAIAAIVVLTLFGGKVGTYFQCVVHDLQNQPCTSNDLATAGPFTPGNFYAAAVQADGPTAYWKMDDGNATLVDAVGGHNASLSGGAVEGIPGALDGGSDRAIDFNGSSGSATANVTALWPTWTLEGWAKTNNLGVMHIVEAAPVEFYVTADGNLEVSVTGIGNVVTLVSSPGLADGNWHYVVASDDGTNVTLYVDGVPRASTTVFGGAASITGSSISIAKASAGGSYFNGPLDEVAVYNTALSPARVLAHFQAANG